MPAPNAPPLWIWIGTIIIVSPVLATFALLAREFVRAKPLMALRHGETNIELWLRERKQPIWADAIIVPVAPDLKMTTGIAKWVRDATANAIQHEAQIVAPLAPGEAFVGSGGRYRFNVTCLAVVMDEYKRTTPEWISSAIARSLVEARQKDATSCLLPDFTEDLLRQPAQITQEQRRATCKPIAHAMIDGILASGGAMEVVRIWVWRAGMEDIFREELAALAAGSRMAAAA